MVNTTSNSINKKKIHYHTKLLVLILVVHFFFSSKYNKMGVFDTLRSTASQTLNDDS